ncbi:MAG: electron transport complex subunit E [Gammaproteobacteria bacterium]|nr:electron transport complex subunit E [Gammaproteobacteria bacterium]MCW8911262.1 electron transport complex subunit E [Gammaproteobacteria bacterium]MCW9006222.1 electron transport complex subunit E [Gammaproteobacteria bacterium]MCW9055862.1 electron transport complex subunit E [Gammaproteobacteria bacterium]
MSDVNYTEINKNGLWNNNVALVQLLGLCPLLAVTGTVINGLGLGIATLLTLVISNTIVSSIRHFVRPEVRVPVFVMIIASIVTTIELTMNAYFHELFNILGIFIPLIVTNCSILARAEAFASKNRILPSALDGLMMGLGFAAVLVLLGAMREALGHGTLFADSHLMFGEIARNWTVVLIDDYSGLLLAILPPGAFIGLGLIIALKNIIDKRMAKRPANVLINTGTEATV